MGPLPKRRISSTRRDKRRTHDRLSTRHLVECDNCGNFRPSHVVCPHCGFYKGRKVLDIEEEL